MIDNAASYSFVGLGITALSWMQVTATLPSRVSICPLQCAVLFPAATASHMIRTFVPIGTGLRKAICIVRETWPPSIKPGLAIVRKVVEVRLSSTVVEQPPCRLPPLLHISGRIVNSHSVRPSFAETNCTSLSTWVSHPLYFGSCDFD